MEIHQLRYFVAVAEEGSFSNAAEREHVSQPSLSQQIHKLEEELNQQLFDRSPKHPRPAYSIWVRIFAIFGDETVDPRGDNGQRYRAELEHSIGMVTTALPFKCGKSDTFKS